MKKLLLLFLLTGLFTVSCDDNLLKPFTPGAVTDAVAVQDSNGLRKLMNSGYNLMTDREDSVFTSVFTDEAGIGYANGGQGITDNYIFFVNQSSFSPGEIWVNTYFALARINRVITYADRLTPVDAADAEIIARTKAEA
ncbi:MAG: hypothetical protein H7096_00660, partial [Flavobacterium sp.]|nr:hypothetical protein [Pedobacter sp.]